MSFDGGGRLPTLSVDRGYDPKVPGGLVEEDSMQRFDAFAARRGRVQSVVGA